MQNFIAEVEIASNFCEKVQMTLFLIKRDESV